jgi:hypothetical protein
LERVVPAYHRGWWSEQRRYGHPGFDGWKSSQDTDTRQRAPTTMLGSSGHSQSRSVWVRGGLRIMPGRASGWPTLLACFDFNFSKIFCDCALVALMAAETNLKNLESQCFSCESCNNVPWFRKDVEATCSLVFRHSPDMTLVRKQASINTPLPNDALHKRAFHSSHNCPSFRIVRGYCSG